MSVWLTGCASLAAKFDQASLCPEGSDKENAGEIYLMTYPSDGYLSLWKERWPWDSSHLGKYGKTRSKLEMVCVEPRVSLLGIRQRQVVFKVSGGNDYVFGSTKYGNTPAGVVAESQVIEAKKLEGRTVWFAYKTKGFFFERLKNLTPYKVKRIDLGTKIIDTYEVYIVVSNEQEDVRVPVIKDEFGNFTVPGKALFMTEPTSENLSLSDTEIKLIKQSRVTVGMSERGVYLSLGYPDKTNRTTTSHGTSKQLVYNIGKTYTKYVYTDSGVVTAIQY